MYEEDSKGIYQKTGRVGSHSIIGTSTSNGSQMSKPACSSYIGISPAFVSEDASELIIGVIVLICTASFFYYLYRVRGMPPGPWGLPLVGYLPWIDKRKPYLSLMDLYQEYGGICTIRLGNILTVVLSEPSYVKEALSQEALAGRAPLWITHGLMNDNGLIAVEGDKWREQRKFAVHCLKSLGAVKFGEKRAAMEKRILEGIRQTFRMIDEKRVEGPFDPKRILFHTIGNIMNSVVFGKTFEYDDEQWIWLQHLAEEGVKLVGIAGPLNFMPYLRFLPYYKKLLEYLKTGQKRTHDAYRRIAQEERSKDNILSYYLDAIDKRKGKYFDEEQMVHLLADMFGAGVDSTLATFRWVLLYLALHPEVQVRLEIVTKTSPHWIRLLFTVCLIHLSDTESQKKNPFYLREKVYKEVDSAIGKGKEPSMDYLSRCPFTEATILETMRIRPVIPLGLPHGAIKDTKISGYNIPKGTMVMVNQWTLHHDRLYWDHPDVFNPMRFISSDGSIKKKESFNPFQNGKRVCFGEELAKMLLFMYTSSLVRRYRIQVEGRALSALEGECGFTLSPAEQALTFLRRA